MTARTWCLLPLALSAVSWGAPAAVPHVDGSAVGEDKFVKEYRETMTEVNAEINRIKNEIKDKPAAVGQAAARAQRAEIASMYAPMADLMRKAEDAQMKMLKRILLAEGSMDQEFDVMLGMPPFAQKGDANVKPKDDGTMKGSPRAGEEEGDLKPSLSTLNSGFSGDGVSGPQAPASGDGSSAQSSVDDVIGGIRDRMKERQQAAARFLASQAKQE